MLLDRVIDGQLEGAHMLAGPPLAATIGFGTQAHIITPFSMDLNGNGITVSNAVRQMMKPNIPKMEDGRPVHPVKADALKSVAEAYKAEGKPFNMGMVFPVSTHNYELRYWLAAGGLHPGYYAPHKGDIAGQTDADALLSVTPPLQMRRWGQIDEPKSDDWYTETDLAGGHGYGVSGHRQRAGVVARQRGGRLDQALAGEGR